MGVNIEMLKKRLLLPVAAVLVAVFAGQWLGIASVLQTDRSGPERLRPIEPWMDDMREQGIRLAVFTFEFDWDDRGRVLTNWRLASVRYYHAYSYSEDSIVAQPDRLTAIRTNGLEAKLEVVALERAKKGGWFEAPAEKEGVGYRDITLADIPWFPDGPFFGRYAPVTTPPETRAQQARQIDLGIRAADSSVQAGEPVTLTISLTNNSKADVNLNSTYTRGRCSDSYVYDVRTEAGRRIAIKEGPSNIPEIGSLMGDTIKPGQTIQESCDLSSEFDLSQPGTYSVQVSRMIPMGEKRPTVKSNKIVITVLPPHAK